KSGAVPAHAGAVTHRNRHPYGAGDRRRNGLRLGGVGHRGRRFRQHGEPHRGPHENLCLRARDLRGGGFARRRRSRRRAAPRDRNPRPGRAARGAHLCERAGPARRAARGGKEGGAGASRVALYRDDLELKSIAPPMSCPAKAGHPVITESLAVTGSPAFAGDDERSDPGAYFSGFPSPKSDMVNENNSVPRSSCTDMVQPDQPCCRMPPPCAVSSRTTPVAWVRAAPTSGSSVPSVSTTVSSSIRLK